MGAKKDIAQNWLESAFAFDKAHPYTGGESAEIAKPLTKMHTLLRRTRRRPQTTGPQLGTRLFAHEKPKRKTPKYPVRNDL